MVLQTQAGREEQVQWLYLESIVNSLLSCNFGETPDIEEKLSLGTYLTVK